MSQSTWKLLQSVEVRTQGLRERHSSVLASKCFLHISACAFFVMKYPSLSPDAAMAYMESSSRTFLDYQDAGLTKEPVLCCSMGTDRHLLRVYFLICCFVTTLTVQQSMDKSLVAFSARLLCWSMCAVCKGYTEYWLIPTLLITWFSCLIDVRSVSWWNISASYINGICFSEFVCCDVPFLFWLICV